MLRCNCAVGFSYNFLERVTEKSQLKWSYLLLLESAKLRFHCFRHCCLQNIFSCFVISGPRKFSDFKRCVPSPGWFHPNGKPVCNDVRYHWWFRRQCHGCWDKNAVLNSDKYIGPLSTFGDIYVTFGACDSCSHNRVGILDDDNYCKCTTAAEIDENHLCRVPRG